MAGAVCNSISRTVVYLHPPSPRPRQHSTSLIQGDSGVLVYGHCVAESRHGYLHLNTSGGYHGAATCTLTRPDLLLGPCCRMLQLRFGKPAASSSLYMYSSRVVRHHRHSSLNFGCTAVAHTSCVERPTIWQVGSVTTCTAAGHERYGTRYAARSCSLRPRGPSNRSGRVPTRCLLLNDFSLC